MKTIDLRTQYADLYKQRRGTVSAVTVPSLTFLMVDGAGHPESSTTFHEAIAILYGFAYTIKFTMRGARPAVDFPVMPLEALWSMSDGGPFRTDRPAKWRWTLMIMVPSVVRASHVRAAGEELARKKGLPLERARLERFREGRAVQALHIGPYTEEERTLELMRAFMDETGLRPEGRHHEIYFSDPRRTPPERFKTILRQPVRKQ